MMMPPFVKFVGLTNGRMISAGPAGLGFVTLALCV